MADPVSWLLIERGWAVADAEGRQIGTVDETVGDSGRDIFSGLAVSTGILGKARFLPAERVEAIEEGRVLTNLRPGEADGLEPHEAPPAVEIRPE